MNKKINTLTILLFLLLIVLAACNQGTSVSDISIQPAEETEQNEEDSALDSIRPIALALLPNEDNWQNYVQFLTTPCTTGDGLGGPPKCEEGMADGTLVEVFPLSDAEGSYATRDTLDEVIQFWLKELHAVYMVPSDAYEEPHWPAGEFGLVYERDVNDVQFPVTVFVEDGKIVRIAYHYITVEEQMQNIPVENVLISPLEADAWLHPEDE